MAAPLASMRRVEDPTEARASLSNGQDAVALHGDGGGFRLSGIEGVNGSILNDQVGGDGGGEVDRKQRKQR